MSAPTAPPADSLATPIAWADGAGRLRGGFKSHFLPGKGQQRLVEDVEAVAVEAQRAGCVVHVGEGWAELQA